jgi:hypothetical protein
MSSYEESAWLVTTGRGARLRRVETRRFKTTRAGAAIDRSILVQAGWVIKLTTDALNFPRRTTNFTRRIALYSSALDRGRVCDAPIAFRARNTSI